ncbi:MAG: hypothetical protein K2W78_13470, partial [Xanthobacteraceae bacterium]|nr:hypothetical protein [Xanthobacteraceae bacterium]
LDDTSTIPVRRRILRPYWTGGKGDELCAGAAAGAAAGAVAAGFGARATRGFFFGFFWGVTG